MLKSMPAEYDVTLLLFQKCGELLTEIPDAVRVIEEMSRFSYLGVSQAACKQKLRRGVLAFLTRKLGFPKAVPFLCKGQKRKLLKEHFDVAVSYQHCAASRSFYGGTAEYVLHRVDAEKKVCFIHCDYQNSGTQSAYADSVYRKFDRVACVSASVREHFLHCVPDMADKCVVVPNAVVVEDILSAAEQEPYAYDTTYCNLLTVARLSREKGIERVLHALSKIDTSKLRYHLVGDGPQREYLKGIVNELSLEKVVCFHGEKDNPYRYMKYADALLLPSYHEAAPVVFQEAKVLGLPILTTDTTSAKEMVGERFGMVCENSEQGIEAMLLKVACGDVSLDAFRKTKACFALQGNVAFIQGIKEVFEDG